jgi:hypothetical protein
MGAQMGHGGARATGAAALAKAAPRLQDATSTCCCRPAAHKSASVRVAWVETALLVRVWRNWDARGFRRWSRRACA